MITAIILVAILLGIIFFWWILQRAKKNAYNQAIQDVEAQALKTSLARVQEINTSQEKVRAEHAKIRDVLPDAWPESGVIELHSQGGGLANQLTSADMQLDRD